MHALDPGAVDPDLVLRARSREVGDSLGVELEADVGLERTIGRGLEEVRAQRRGDEREERSQDAVLVEAGDVLEHRLDLGVRRRLGGLAIAGELGVEPHLEIAHDRACDRDVGEHALLDVDLAERRARLPEIARVGTQDHDLTPGQTRCDDEAVEPVDLGPSGPRGEDRVLESQLEGVEVEGLALLHPQTEVVDPRAGVDRLDLVRTLVDDLDAHPREHGQHGGQRDGRTAAVDLEPALSRRGSVRLVEVERDVAIGDQRVELLEVEGPGTRREVLLVGLGKGSGVHLVEARSLFLAEHVVEGRDEVVLPRSRGIGKGLLQRIVLDEGQRRP